MRYELVNITTSQPRELTLGTCDMCMYTVTEESPLYHLKDNNGGIHVIDGLVQDVDTVNNIYIENVAHFANWIKTQDIEQPVDSNYDFWWLKAIVEKYDEYKLQEAFDYWVTHKVSIVNDYTIEILFDEYSLPVVRNKDMLRVCDSLLPIYIPSEYGEIMWSAEKEKEADITWFATTSDLHIEIWRGSAYRKEVEEEIVVPCWSTVSIVFDDQGMEPVITSFHRRQ